MTDKDVSPEMIELLHLYKVESKRIIPSAGKNIVEILGEFLRNCVRCTAVEHWPHITTDFGKLWVGIYLLGAATEIGNSFGFDSKVSRLALAFTVLGENIFSTEEPLEAFAQITKLPDIDPNSDSPFLGSNNLGSVSARRWIDADFQGMFPTSNLTMMLELYDRYALPTAKNIEGREAFKQLFKSLSPSIKVISSNDSKMSDDHNIVRKSGKSEEVMENNEELTNTKIVFEKLAEEGFRPTLENDFSIKLKYEGSVFWVDLSENDDELYEVISAFIWSIDSPGELANAYIAASEASRTTTVAKVWVTSNQKNVWVKSSMLCKDANGFTNVLLRALNTTRSAKSKFIEKIRKLEADRLDAEEPATIAVQDEVEIELYAKQVGGETWSTAATYVRSLGTISDINDDRFIKIKESDGFLFTAIVNGVDLDVKVEYKEDENSFAIEELPF